METVTSGGQKQTDDMTSQHLLWPHVKHISFMA